MRTASVLLLSLFCSAALGADKKIDPAVLAAWAWSQPTAKADPATIRENWGGSWGWVERGPDGVYRQVSGPGGAAPQTFRSGDRNPTHRCPSCGYQSPAGQGTWIVRGYNGDGSHNHSCPRCGESWRH